MHGRWRLRGKLVFHPQSSRGRRWQGEGWRGRADIWWCRWWKSWLVQKEMHWIRSWYGSIEKDCNLLNGFTRCVADGKARCCRSWYIEDCKDVLCGMPEEVFCGCARKGDGLWKILNSIGDACCICCWYEAGDAAVMVHCGSNIPGICPSGCPGGAVVWFFMYQAFCSKRCNGSGIEIEASCECGICRHFWVVTARSEKVQHCFALR